MPQGAVALKRRLPAAMRGVGTGARSPLHFKIRVTTPDVHLAHADQRVALRVVGIELDRPLQGNQRLVVPATPDQHVAESDMAGRLAIVELDGATGPR